MKGGVVAEAWPSSAAGDDNCIHSFIGRVHSLIHSATKEFFVVADLFVTGLKLSLLLSSTASPPLALTASPPKIV